MSGVRKNDPGPGRPSTQPVHPLLGVALIVVVVVVGLEGGLRLLSLVRPARYFHYLTAPWVIFDNPYWEVWHPPSARADYVKACLRVTYTSNAWGMRDKPRTLEKQTFRVAVLGDSMTEGHGVNDVEVFTRLLEDEHFRGEVQFLNFGVQGSGTIQAWQLYRHLARRFRPDLVLLMFFHDNDLVDNSWWYWERYAPDRRRPYLRPAAGGHVLFYPPVPLGSGTGGSRERLLRLKNRVATLSYLVRYLDEVRLTLSMRGLTQGEMDETNVYRVSPTPLWEQSWNVTAEALRRLHEQVKADGAKLVVVQLPGWQGMDPRADAAVASRPGFDPLYPERRLARIVASLQGARFFSLSQPFASFRDANGLRPPYLSYPCDGHWSPLGHRVAAAALADFLLRSGLLPTLSGVR
ncbi:MAG: SGNH/GDSL hydrolase family protein [bacterium]